MDYSSGPVVTRQLGSENTNSGINGHRQTFPMEVVMANVQKVKASSIGEFRELHSPARCSQGRVEANLSVIRIGQQATMPTFQTCHPHGRKDDNHMLSSW
jgi:hypothetical protein